MNFFKHFDLLGHAYSLEEYGKSRHVSYQGIIMSLIVFFASFVLCVLYGKELIERKNPKVSYSKEYSKSKKVYLKDLEYYFLFVSSIGVPMNDFENYLDFDIILMQYRNGKIIPKFLGLERCDFKNYKHSDLLLNSIMAGGEPRCLKANDDEDFINGMIGDMNTNFLQIVVSTCNPSDTKRTTKCIISNTFFDRVVMFANFFVTSFLNSNSYETPLNYYMSTDIHFIRPDQAKSVRYYLTQDIFVSDYGWLLENNKELITYNLNKIDKEVNFSLDTVSQGIIGAKPRERLMTFTIQVERIANKITRNYLKIQELIASIGGISNALFLIVKLFSQNYFRYLFIKQIRENCFYENNVLNESNFFYLGKLLIMSPFKKKLNINNSNIKNQEKTEIAKENIEPDYQVFQTQSSLVKNEQNYENEKSSNVVKIDNDNVNSYKPSDVVKIDNDNVSSNNNKNNNENNKIINFNYEFKGKNIKLCLNPKITNKLQAVFYENQSNTFEFNYWNYFTSFEFPFKIRRNLVKIHYFKIEVEKINEILSFNSLNMILLKLYYDLLSDK